MAKVFEHNGRLVRIGFFAEDLDDDAWAFVSERRDVSYRDDEGLLFTMRRDERGLSLLKAEAPVMVEAVAKLAEEGLPKRRCWTD